jgi:hypothetical protein
VVITIGDSIYTEISSTYSTILINKFRLAQGEPKSEFWKSNIGEYRQLCDSESMVEGRTNGLRSLLTSAMAGPGLVVGSLADVQFIDRQFGDGSPFCVHDKVLAIRNTYATLAGDAKGCYNKMRTSLGEILMKELKKFVCSRFIIGDGNKTTRITDADLVIGSHDCAIDAVYHMINYITACLLGKLAIVGALSL